MNFVLYLLAISLPLIPFNSSGCSAMQLPQVSLMFYNLIQVHPMAAVATAERGLIVYQLENQPSEFRRIESPLKHQVNNNICIYTYCSHPGLDIFCKNMQCFKTKLPQHGNDLVCHC